MTPLFNGRAYSGHRGVICHPRYLLDGGGSQAPNCSRNSRSTAPGISQMWDGTAFSGTKIALVCGERTVAYLRDDKPGIPYPAMWDLPGGGREGDESPIDCALREVEEEFGLKLVAANVVLVERHRSTGAGLDTYFCAMKIGSDDVASIAFGNEGQRWELMSIFDFVRHDRAVPQLKNRLRAAADAGLF
jgi:8-oxo-dGTP diphosphatase